MSKKSYISKNLNQDQISFLKLMREKEIEYFDMHLIENVLGKKFDNINGIFENLARKGFLKRLQRGYYADANFNNSFVIGTFIAGKSAVSYWSALNLHGLADRFPNTVFIQTLQRKRDISVSGTAYKFVAVKESKIAGIIKSGYGSNEFPITDIEKTIVDCFDLPKYSGGFDLLVSAFFNAELNAEKLIEYSKAVNNISAVKRMGFLAELFNKKELGKFIKFALSSVNERYVLIDASGEESGDFDNKWRLRLNVSKDELKGIVGAIY